MLPFFRAGLRPGLAAGARCCFTQGTVFAVRLASGSPDDTVDQRFNAAAANRRGSQTYQEGVEWVGVSELRDHRWRDQNMHKHAAAPAVKGHHGDRPELAPTVAYVEVPGVSRMRVL